MKMFIVIMLSFGIGMWIASNAFVSPDTIVKAMRK
jgi:hypothetical protein